MKATMSNLKYAGQAAMSWSHVLNLEFERSYFKDLERYLEEEIAQGKVIYPSMPNVFRALELTPIWNVKVVIIGQDPYHQPDQANGLAFSVKPTTKLTPTLKNIYRALNTDLNIQNSNGDLTFWGAQGVLLLNTILTVERGKPLSHKGKGWEKLTDKLIHNLDASAKPLVFILWGKEAQSKKKLIEGPHHLILEAPHPSPLSAHTGFFWCKHFSKTNEFLIKNGVSPIEWRIL